MNKLLLIFSSLFLILLLSQCTSKKKGVQLPIDQAPFEKLSDYQFFQGNLADLQANERVLPYDLNSPLFSDYAEKSRFVWMPEGTSANYKSDEVFDFPIGTVLIKTFYYNHDAREKSKGKRNIETRLLVKRTDKWDAIDYTWNEEQTEAYLDIVGDIKEVAWINHIGEAMNVDYIIPNKNQCKGCHYNKGILEPIGPKGRNLNKEYAYTDGQMNQLKKWSSVGFLKGYDETKEHPSVAQWENPNSGSLHERAMGYLDINCGHCHNPNGPANTTGLNLVADAPQNMALGIYKSSVAAGQGTGGRKYNIVPGQPDQSILTYRMASTDPGAMMPELGRRMVHQEGVELIREWIEKMKIPVTKKQ